MISILIATLVSLLTATRQDSCRVWTFADPDALVEDVVFYSIADRYLVTSVRRGGVFAIDREGRTTAFIAPDMATWGTFAIGLDATHHTLWVTTFSYPGSARYASANTGHAAILEYDYPRGRLRRRWQFADTAARAVGDLTIAPNGDLFVTASIGGGVYAIDRGASAIRTVRPAHTYRSPQTPAVSDDGRYMYIPDYAVGIARLDLGTGRATWLSHAPDLDLTGIDGMYLRGSSLIAVQNGSPPNRIVRLAVRGDSIVRAEVVVAGGDAVDLNHAVIVNSEIRFMAHSGWARMSDAGVMTHGGAADAPRLLRICGQQGQSR